ncbi:MAG: isoprenylcysteine carboxylmethyltransferase family protein [Anaerolineales bacterium]|nr:isoprenylcysteine carboxylmethyltransferase family protein [Anaerolineales bacterium]MCB9126658.1 isoprenylcysteine carboxylmethyltransferase family protein [Ardenticatenales bacterium]MCB9171802.1 isoprenylcysteine carboxylmethyltransferase family protein [Ardenticatenales bacterium]
MNRRGEAWVVGQFLIGAAIAVAPASWPLLNAPWLRALGIVLALLGLFFGALASWQLGRNLTPFPKPKADGHLVHHGLYQFVRHPIYFSVLLLAFGWAFWRLSGWGLLLALFLFVFFDAKARREEAWLRTQYPDYARYQQRVKKLLPWIY